jgi:hypothetical protein
MCRSCPHACMTGTVSPERSSTSRCSQMGDRLLRDWKGVELGAEHDLGPGPFLMTQPLRSFPLRLPHRTPALHSRREFRPPVCTSWKAKLRVLMQDRCRARRCPGRWRRLSAGVGVLWPPPVCANDQADPGQEKGAETPHEPHGVAFAIVSARLRALLLCAANVTGLPSARMPRTNIPPGEPSRIGRIVSVTFSPCLKVFFDQPRRDN